MGAKFFAIGTLVVMGLILTDALLHPNGVKQLGDSTNTILQTTGNQLIGVGSNKVYGS
jgi:hypothetical protein